MCENSLWTQSDAYVEAHHAVRKCQNGNQVPPNTDDNPDPLTCCNLFYLFVQLPLVESQLLALENVAIAAARLAGTAGDDGVQATSLELLLNGVLDLALGGEALGLLLLDRLALLDLFLLDALSLLASTAKGLAVVSLVPLTEGGGVDLDDGGAGQGVGTDELVVGRVIGDGNDTGLAGAALGGPGKVARVEAEGTELVVTATGADGVNTLGADTGVGTLAASLESALLPCCQRSEHMFC